MKIMKAVILVVALFIILSLATQARSQSQPNIAIDTETIIAKAKQASIHSSKINWDSLTIQLQQARNADPTRKMKTLLLALNDHRALFYDPATKTAIVNATTPVNTAGNSSEFYFSILDNNICYLRLTAIAPGKSIQTQAAQVRQAVDSLSKGNALQWIIDLRSVTDGDQLALGAGLAPLLDEGLVATAIDNHNKIKNMYTVHNGNLYVDQIPVTKFPLWTKDMRKAKIAVLTSRYTSGAAEFLTLGLKGRKNTRVFGEATAGNNLGMADIEISKNVVMRLATLRYVDRAGNDYNERIYPDVKVDFSSDGNATHDKAISAATAWLTSIPEAPIALGMNRN